MRPRVSRLTSLRVQFVLISQQLSGLRGLCVNGYFAAPPERGSARDLTASAGNPLGPSTGGLSRAPARLRTMARFAVLLRDLGLRIVGTPRISIGPADYHINRD